jgi:glutamine amidotransferase
MSAPDVVIVDYGMGNVGSIRNMFAKIGATAELSGDPDEVAKADRLLLPGVGAFDEAMTTLRRKDLVEPILERSASGRGPLLGVCLGMQLLLDASEEGVESGLGLISGVCTRFPTRSATGPLRVPHMGWNDVTVRRPDALLPSLGVDARYYFVHSYRAEPSDGDHVTGTTTYGVPFASAIGHDDIAGVQFHPEKSHRHGLRLLAGFVGL